MYNKQIEQALNICKSELKIDNYYKETLSILLDDLDNKYSIKENIITYLFIFQNLEKIGDSFLNIGESIISAVVGEKLKIEQYQAIEESLEESKEYIINNNYFHFESIGETKSGCRIGKVFDTNGNNRTIEIIFKEGKKEKILNEKKNIENWSELVNGIAPKIYNYNEHNNNASLLLQKLEGNTILSLLINGQDKLLDEAFTIFTETIEENWIKTKKDTPSKCVIFESSY